MQSSARRYPDFADRRLVLRPSSPTDRGRSGSPLTVARPCRIYTGFPRTRTQSSVRASGREVPGLMLTLVLGPVRAGKSTRAIALARASGKSVVVAATAAIDPSDAEMVDRVARHRRARPPEWRVIETAQGSSDTLVALLRDASAGECIVVDALGTWLAAQLLERRGRIEDDVVATLDALDAQSMTLADALAHTRADVIVVAEETGWGVVPATALGRIFRDALGRLSQEIARRADRVELVVAGFAIDVRALGMPVDEVRL